MFLITSELMDVRILSEARAPSQPISAENTYTFFQYTGMSN